MNKTAAILFFLLVPATALPQKVTTDTVFIDFRPDTLVPLNYAVASVVDYRGVHPGLISYVQRKKFVIVPVDQALLTREKLASILKKGFQTSAGGSDTLLLGISYFTIDRYKGYLGSPYILKADFPLHRISACDTLPAGTLVYNYFYQPPSGRKVKKEQVYSSLLERWHTEFKMDLMITAGYWNNDNPAPENLIGSPLRKAHFLHAQAGGVIGLNFWQLEGELYFARPETGRQQRFLGSIVRYQHTRDFEMIGFGNKAEHFASRINDTWTFDISSNALLGFVKWKETENIKLYQIPLLSISSCQTVNLNRRNTAGIQFRAGLFENLYYVIGMKLKLQAGLCLGAGYKF